MPNRVTQFNHAIYKEGKSRYSPVLRVISGILIVSFAFQEVAQAAGESNWISSKSSSVSSNPPVNIPKYLGNFQSTNIRNSKETIIHIQDAHDSLQAQQKINEILNLLLKEYHVKSVALEGSSGAIDPMLFKTYPDQDVARESAELLVKQGRLNAGELFAITSAQPVSVYGVEDRTLYRENLKVFRDLLNNKEKIESDLKGLSRTLEVLGERIYSVELKEVLKNDILAEDSSLSFTKKWEHLKDLAKEKGIDFAVYPNLRILSEVSELEKEINFNKANVEREELLTRFQDVLSASDFENVVLQSLNFKTGKISDSEFHFFLNETAHHAGIGPAGYPHLVRYTRYLLLFETLDISRLFGEFGTLGEKIKNAYFGSEDERALNELQKVSQVLVAVLSGNASSDEVAFLDSDPERFDPAAIETKISELAEKYHTPLYNGMNFKEMFRALPTARRFYGLAEKRNQALIQNTLKKMKAEDQRVAALVTGGFHTKGISDILKSENLSYLVVLPRITDPNKKRPYITILTRKTSEYKKAFSSKSSSYKIVIGTLLDAGHANGDIKISDLKVILRPLVEGLRKKTDSKKELEQWMENYGKAYQGEAVKNKLLDPIKIETILHEMMGITEPYYAMAGARMAEEARSRIMIQAPEVVQLTGIEVFKGWREIRDKLLPNLSGRYSETQVEESIEQITGKDLERLQEARLTDRALVILVGTGKPGEDSALYFFNFDQNKRSFKPVKLVLDPSVDLSSAHFQIINPQRKDGETPDEFLKVTVLSGGQKEGEKAVVSFFGPRGERLLVDGRHGTEVSLEEDGRYTVTLKESSEVAGFAFIPEDIGERSVAGFFSKKLNVASAMVFAASVLISLGAYVSYAHGGQGNVVGNVVPTPGGTVFVITAGVFSAVVYAVYLAQIAALAVLSRIRESIAASAKNKTSPLAILASIKQKLRQSAEGPEGEEPAYTLANRFFSSLVFYLGFAGGFFILGLVLPGILNVPFLVIAAFALPVAGMSGWLWPIFSSALFLKQLEILKQGTRELFFGPEEEEEADDSIDLGAGTQVDSSVDSSGVFADTELNQPTAPPAGPGSGTQLDQTKASVAVEEEVPGVTFMTDIGSRSNQEDEVFVAARGGIRIAGVFDGMGGHGAGEVASGIGADIFKRAFAGEFEPEGIRFQADMSENELRAVVFKVVQKILDAFDQAIASGRGARKMGFTMAMAIEMNGRAYVFNCGDARCYVQYADGRVELLTRDHSMVQALLESKSIKNHEAATLPVRTNVLSSVQQGYGLMTPEEASKMGDLENLPDKKTYVQFYQPVEMKAVKRLILTSDGVPDEFAPESVNRNLQDAHESAALLTEVLNEADKIDQAVTPQFLIDRAKGYSSSRDDVNMDNMSVIFFEPQGSDRPKTETVPDISSTSDPTPLVFPDLPSPEESRIPETPAPPAEPTVIVSPAPALSPVQQIEELLYQIRRSYSFWRRFFWDRAAFGGLESAVNEDSRIPDISKVEILTALLDQCRTGSMPAAGLLSAYNQQALESYQLRQAGRASLENSISDLRGQLVSLGDHAQGLSEQAGYARQIESKIGDQIVGVESRIREAIAQMGGLAPAEDETAEALSRRVDGLKNLARLKLARAERSDDLKNARTDLAAAKTESNEHEQKLAHRGILGRVFVWVRNFFRGILSWLTGREILFEEEKRSNRIRETVDVRQAQVNRLTESEARLTSEIDAFEYPEYRGLSVDEIDPLIGNLENLIGDKMVLESLGSQRASAQAEVSRLEAEQTQTQNDTAATQEELESKQRELTAFDAEIVPKPVPVEPSSLASFMSMFVEIAMTGFSVVMAVMFVTGTAPLTWPFVILTATVLAGLFCIHAIFEPETEGAGRTAASWLGLRRFASEMGQGLGPIGSFFASTRFDNMAFSAIVSAGAVFVAWVAAVSLLGAPLSIAYAVIAALTAAAVAVIFVSEIPAEEESEVLNFSSVFRFLMQPRARAVILLSFFGFVMGAVTWALILNMPLLLVLVMPVIFGIAGFFVDVEDIVSVSNDRAPGSKTISLFSFIFRTILSGAFVVGTAHVLSLLGLTKLVLVGWPVLFAVGVVVFIGWNFLRSLHVPSEDRVLSETGLRVETNLLGYQRVVGRPAHQAMTTLTGFFRYSWLGLAIASAFGDRETIVNRIYYQFADHDRDTRDEFLQRNIGYGRDDLTAGQWFRLFRLLWSQNNQDRLHLNNRVNHPAHSSHPEDSLRAVLYEKIEKVFDFLQGFLRGNSPLVFWTRLVLTVPLVPVYLGYELMHSFVFYLVGHTVGYVTSGDSVRSFVTSQHAADILRQSIQRERAVEERIDPEGLIRRVRHFSPESGEPLEKAFQELNAAFGRRSPLHRAMAPFRSIGRFLSRNAVAEESLQVRQQRAMAAFEEALFDVKLSAAAKAGSDDSDYVQSVSVLLGELERYGHRVMALDNFWERLNYRLNRNGILSSICGLVVILSLAGGTTAVGIFLVRRFWILPASEVSALLLPFLGASFALSTAVFAAVFSYFVLRGMYFSVRYGRPVNPWSLVTAAFLVTIVLTLTCFGLDFPIGDIGSQSGFFIGDHRVGMELSGWMSAGMFALLLSFFKTAEERREAILTDRLNQELQGFAAEQISSLSGLHYSHLRPWMDSLFDPLYAELLPSLEARARALAFMRRNIVLGLFKLAPREKQNILQRLSRAADQLRVEGEELVAPILTQPVSLPEGRSPRVYLASAQEQAYADTLASPRYWINRWMPFGVGAWTVPHEVAGIVWTGYQGDSVATDTVRQIGVKLDEVGVENKLVYQKIDLFHPIVATVEGDSLAAGLNQGGMLGLANALFDKIFNQVRHWMGAEGEVPFNQWLGVQLGVGQWAFPAAAQERWIFDQERIRGIEIRIADAELRLSEYPASREKADWMFALTRARAEKDFAENLPRERQAIEVLRGRVRQEGTKDEQIIFAGGILDRLTAYYDPSESGQGDAYMRTLVSQLLIAGRIKSAEADFINRFSSEVQISLDARARVQRSLRVLRLTTVEGPLIQWGAVRPAFGQMTTREEAKEMIDRGVRKELRQLVSHPTVEEFMALLKDGLSDGSITIEEYANSVNDIIAILKDVQMTDPSSRESSPESQDLMRQVADLRREFADVSRKINEVSLELQKYSETVAMDEGARRFIQSRVESLTQIQRELLDERSRVETALRQAESDLAAAQARSRVLGDKEELLNRRLRSELDRRIHDLKRAEEELVAMRQRKLDEDLRAVEADLQAQLSQREIDAQLIYIDVTRLEREPQTDKTRAEWRQAKDRYLALERQMQDIQEHIEYRRELRTRAGEVVLESLLHAPVYHIELLDRVITDAERHAGWLVALNHAEPILQIMRARRTTLARLNQLADVEGRRAIENFAQEDVRSREQYDLRRRMQARLRHLERREQELNRRPQDPPASRRPDIRQQVNYPDVPAPILLPEATTPASSQGRRHVDQYGSVYMRDDEHKDWKAQRGYQLIERGVGQRGGERTTVLIRNFRRNPDGSFSPVEWDLDPNNVRQEWDYDRNRQRYYMWDRARRLWQEVPREAVVAGGIAPGGQMVRTASGTFQFLTPDQVDTLRAEIAQGYRVSPSTGINFDQLRRAEMESMHNQFYGEGEWQQRGGRWEWVPKEEKKVDWESLVPDADRLPRRYYGTVVQTPNGLRWRIIGPDDPRHEVIRMVRAAEEQRRREPGRWVILPDGRPVWFTEDDFAALERTAEVITVGNRRVKRYRIIDTVNRDRLQDPGREHIIEVTDEITPRLRRFGHYGFVIAEPTIQHVDRSRITFTRNPGLSEGNVLPEHIQLPHRPHEPNPFFSMPDFNDFLNQEMDDFANYDRRIYSRFNSVTIQEVARHVQSVLSRPENQARLQQIWQEQFYPFYRQLSFIAIGSDPDPINNYIPRQYPGLGSTNRHDKLTMGHIFAAMLMDDFNGFEHSAAFQRVLGDLSAAAIRNLDLSQQGPWWVLHQAMQARLNQVTVFNLRVMLAEVNDHLKWARWPDIRLERERNDISREPRFDEHLPGYGPIVMANHLLTSHIALTRPLPVREVPDNQRGFEESVERSRRNSIEPRAAHLNRFSVVPSFMRPIENLTSIEMIADQVRSDLDRAIRNLAPNDPNRVLYQREADIYLYNLQELLNPASAIHELLPQVERRSKEELSRGLAQAEFHLERLYGYGVEEPLPGVFVPMTYDFPSIIRPLDHRTPVERAALSPALKRLMQANPDAFFRQVRRGNVVSYVRVHFGVSGLDNYIADFEAANASHLRNFPNPQQAGELRAAQARLEDLRNQLERDKNYFQNLSAQFVQMMRLVDIRDQLKPRGVDLGVVSSRTVPRRIHMNPLDEEEETAAANDTSLVGRDDLRLATLQGEEGQLENDIRDRQTDLGRVENEAVLLRGILANHTIDPAWTPNGPLRFYAALLDKDMKVITLYPSPNRVPYEAFVHLERRESQFQFLNPDGTRYVKLANAALVNVQTGRIEELFDGINPGRMLGRYMADASLAERTDRYLDRNNYPVMAARAEISEQEANDFFAFRRNLDPQLQELLRVITRGRFLKSPLRHVEYDETTGKYYGWFYGMDFDTLNPEATHPLIYDPQNGPIEIGGLRYRPDLNLRMVFGENAALMPRYSEELTREFRDILYGLVTQDPNHRDPLFDLMHGLLQGIDQAEQQFITQGEFGPLNIHTQHDVTRTIVEQIARRRQGSWRLSAWEVRRDLYRALIELITLMESEGRLKLKAKIVIYQHPLDARRIHHARAMQTFVWEGGGWARTNEWIHPDVNARAPRIPLTPAQIQARQNHLEGRVRQVTDRLRNTAAGTLEHDRLSSELRQLERLAAEDITPVSGGRRILEEILIKRRQRDQKRREAIQRERELLQQRLQPQQPQQQPLVPAGARLAEGKKFKPGVEELEKRETPAILTETFIPSQNDTFRFDLDDQGVLRETEAVPDYYQYTEKAGLQTIIDLLTKELEVFQSSNGSVDIFLRHRDLQQVGSPGGQAATTLDTVVLRESATGNILSEVTIGGYYAAQVKDIQFTSDQNFVVVHASEVSRYEPAKVHDHFLVFNARTGEFIVDFGERFELNDISDIQLNNDSVVLTYQNRAIDRPETEPEVQHTDTFYFTPQTGKLVATSSDGNVRVLLMKEPFDKVVGGYTYRSIRENLILWNTTDNSTAVLNANEFQNVTAYAQVFPWKDRTQLVLPSPINLQNGSVTLNYKQLATSTHQPEITRTLILEAQGPSVGAQTESLDELQVVVWDGEKTIDVSRGLFNSPTTIHVKVTFGLSSSGGSVQRKEQFTYDPETSRSVYFTLRDTTRLSLETPEGLEVLERMTDYVRQSHPLAAQSDPTEAEELRRIIGILESAKAPSHTPIISAPAQAVSVQPTTVAVLTPKTATKPVNIERDRFFAEVGRSGIDPVIVDTLVKLKEAKKKSRGLISGARLAKEEPGDSGISEAEKLITRISTLEASFEAIQMQIGSGKFQNLAELSEEMGPLQQNIRGAYEAISPKARQLRDSLFLAKDIETIEALRNELLVEIGKFRERAASSGARMAAKNKDTGSEKKSWFGWNKKAYLITAMLAAMGAGVAYVGYEAYRRRFHPTTQEQIEDSLARERQKVRLEKFKSITDKLGIDTNYAGESVERMHLSGQLTRETLQKRFGIEASDIEDVTIQSRFGLIVVKLKNGGFYYFRLQTNKLVDDIAREEVVKRHPSVKPEAITITIEVVDFVEEGVFGGTVVARYEKDGKKQRTRFDLRSSRLLTEGEDSRDLSSSERRESVHWKITKKTQAFELRYGGSFAGEAVEYIRSYDVQFPEYQDKSLILVVDPEKKLAQFTVDLRNFKGEAYRLSVADKENGKFEVRSTENPDTEASALLRSDGRIEVIIPILEVEQFLEVDLQTILIHHGKDQGNPGDFNIKNAEIFIGEKKPAGSRLAAKTESGQPILIAVTHQSDYKAVLDAVKGREGVHIYRVSASKSEDNLKTVETIARKQGVENPIVLDGDFNLEAKIKLLDHLNKLDAQRQDLIGSLLRGETDFAQLSSEDKRMVYAELIKILPSIAPKVINQELIDEKAMEGVYQDFMLRTFHPSFSDNFENIPANVSREPKAMVWTLEMVLENPFFFDEIRRRKEKLQGKMTIEDHVIVESTEGLEAQLGARYEEFMSFFQGRIHVSQASSIESIYADIKGQYKAENNVLFVDKEDKKSLSIDSTGLKVLMVRGRYAISVNALGAQILAGSHDFIVKGRLEIRGNVIFFEPIVPIDFQRVFQKFYEAVASIGTAA